MMLIKCTAQNEDTLTKRDLKLTKRFLIRRDESKSSDLDESNLRTENELNDFETNNQLKTQKDDEDVK